MAQENLPRVNKAIEHCISAHHSYFSSLQGKFYCKIQDSSSKGDATLILSPSKYHVEQ